MLLQDIAHFFEKLHTVRAQIRIIVVRKQLSDVAQRSRTQQRVHDGMHQHVCVRVSVEPLFKRNLHTAQNQLSPLDQTVYIVSMSDSHGVCLRFRISPAISRSSGVVILMFSSEPSVSSTVMPSASTAEQSSVSESPFCFAFCSAPSSSA